MISWKASAPGKLVLVGEYAVLEGYEALGAAVNRRVHVTWQQREPMGQSVQLPPVVPTPMLDPFRSNSVVPEPAVDALANIKAIFESFAPNALDQNFSLEVDSRALYWDDCGKDGRSKEGWNKLGLGSSAAVTVALAGLAVGLNDQEVVGQAEIHRRLMALHQGGGGSGVDLATALHGGLIRYQRGKAIASPASWHECAWPSSLHGLVVWSGEQASTPQFIQAYRQWKSTNKAAWSQQMQTMAQCAGACIDALARGDVSAFVEGFTEYGARMGTMGGLMGQEIVTPVHQAIGQLAKRGGVGYKPCGAGGGDVGLCISDDLDALASVQQKLAAMGLEALPLGIDLQGLSVEKV